MSKLDTMLEFKELVDSIQEKGTDLETSTLLYHLFDGDDIYELLPNSKNLSYSVHTDEVEEFLSSKGYEHIESEGGHEGGGEYCYGIIKVKDKHYKAEWSYYSYNGCEYDYIEDTLKEVTPVEKVITVYE